MLNKSTSEEGSLGGGYSKSSDELSRNDSPLSRERSVEE